MSPAPISISVAEHLAAVLAGVRRLPAVRVALADAHGCVLVQDIVAAVDSPGFDNSAMDGYALRRADVLGATAEAPIVVAVIADLPAGTALNPSVGTGQAARIMTGAPIPDGADAVVPFEQTDAGVDKVAVRVPPSAGAHIRRRGSDAARGAVLFGAGHLLTARHLAAAAAVGLRELEIVPRPRVGIIATGSELVGPGSPLLRGQVHDSNTTMVAAAILEAGGMPVVLGRSVDRPEALLGLLEQAGGSVDAVVMTGGVGEGAYDVVRAALARTGDVSFATVRLQPGKPQAFGHWRDGTPLFGLPGNPVAAYVSFTAFVEPALRVMGGLPPQGRPPIVARAGAAWSSRRDREQRVPVSLATAPDGALTAWPSGSGAHTHQLSALAVADGIAVIGEGAGDVAAGDQITVLPMAGWAE